ncbi:hypothetical protein AAMO2058_001443600 [Amorphochlora amoebiformis]|mmetsp:Transcript_22191/g.34903  ORF Transcript_22191/g.34903 Transcript_22191/m.34903 type:complete len:330 (-) Transcript_22191:260-1249(-)
MTAQREDLETEVKPKVGENKVAAAKEKWQKWKEENKQPVFSNGYLFDCFGHDIHITEVIPLTLFVASIIMFFLLVSNVDIQSVIFAGMAMGTSGLALLAFWNYKAVMKPREQADLLEALAKQFEGQVGQQQENNDQLQKEVTKLREDTDAIEKESTEIQKQLGILNKNGTKIKGVLEGYKGFLKSKEKLDDFREKEIAIREHLILLEADALITSKINRVKRNLKRQYDDWRDYDEDSGDYKDTINVKKKPSGEYENETFVEFLQAVMGELKDYPDVQKNFKQDIDKADSDGDGKLTMWEFMIMVDKSLDIWADKTRKEHMAKKVTETKI